MSTFLEIGNRNIMITTCKLLLQFTQKIYFHHFITVYQLPREVCDGKNSKEIKKHIKTSSKLLSE